MITLLALRNPGEKYTGTRHNVGEIALASYVEARIFPEPHRSAKLSADVSEGVVENVSVRALFSNVFMNESGAVARKVEDALLELVVLHDDIHMPVGTFKVSFGRGSGGNNGIASIINALGTKDFIRIRIGVAPLSLLGKPQIVPGDRRARFVLGTFTRRELKYIDAMLPRLHKALDTVITKGVGAAMNIFNEK